MKKKISEALKNDLKELNKQLAHKMMNIIHAKKAENKEDDESIIEMNHLGPRLVFPLLRDGKVRISEQESKIIYCSVLNNTNYYYSVETPTKEGYSFSGSKELSARSDISIYTIENDRLRKQVNVELKSGNPETNSISKDIEKLIRENILGNWVHTLQSVRSNTLSTLFEKFVESFTGVFNPSNKKPLEGKDDLQILFMFLIIGQKRQRALIKFFNLPVEKEEKNIREKYIKDFFTIDYENLCKDHPSPDNGWEILTYKLDER